MRTFYILSFIIALTNISQANAEYFICKDRSSDYAIKNDKTAEVMIQNGYIYLRKSQLLGSERSAEEYKSKITPVEIQGVTYIAGMAMNDTGIIFPKMHHFYFLPQTKMFYFDQGVYLDFDRKTVGHGGIYEYKCN